MTRQENARRALGRWGKHRKDIDHLLYSGCAGIVLLAGFTPLLTPGEVRSMLPFYVTVCGAYAGSGALMAGVLTALAFLARSDRSENPDDGKPGEGKQE